MTYGEAKLKDIAESVLPSKRRKGARDELRYIKQKNRRNINRQLAKIDSIDTYLDDPRVEDINFYPNSDIYQAVLSRRNADNIAGLMQWAEFRVKKEGITDPHYRYDFVKRAMPDNLIGRHALSHVESVEGFCSGTGDSFRSECPEHATWRFYRFAETKEEQEARIAVERAAFRDKVRAKLNEPGGHAALNRAIKRAHSNLTHSHRWNYRLKMIPTQCDCLPRTIAGTHDIEAWIKDVFHGPTHNEWSKAAMRVLGTY